MAYRKRWSMKRRRPMMRRRRFIKRRRYGARSKYSGASIVRLKRSVPLTFLGNATTGAPYKFDSKLNVSTFRLDTLPQYTEFTNLFKEFRIRGVKLRWHLRKQPGQFLGGGDAAQVVRNTYPQLYYSTQATGTEDADIGYASIPDALCDSSTKQRILTPESVVSYYIRSPTVASTTYSSGVTPSYVDMKRVWCSTLDTQVLHYGGKVLIDQFIDPNQAVDLTVTYYLEFRGIR